jgi:hypothetical protein
MFELYSRGSSIYRVDVIIKRITYISVNIITRFDYPIYLFFKNYYSTTAGGKLLLELNRVLRPGGYFVWSATPVYQKLSEDVEIWNGKL